MEKYQELKEINIHQIRRNPHQPRRIFDEKKLEELRQSIRENGLLQPITVTEDEKGYQLIAGERRWMACKGLALEKIPAIVLKANEEQSAVLSLLENIQRADLNYFEEAYALMGLMELTGMGQDAVAKRIGKATSTVANKLRLCSLPRTIQKKLLEYQLTERHARALLKLTHQPDRLETVIEHIHQNRYNVAQTDQYIERLCKEETSKQRCKLKIQDTRLFMNSIKKAIGMMKLAGIEIQTTLEEHEEYTIYTMQIPKQCKKSIHHGAATSSVLE